MGIHSYLMCSNMSLSINLTFIFLMCSKISPSVNLTLINLMSLLQLSRSKYLLILTCDVHPLHASLNAHPPHSLLSLHWHSSCVSSSCLAVNIYSYWHVIFILYMPSPLTSLLTLTFVMFVPYMPPPPCYLTYADICDVRSLHGSLPLLLYLRWHLWCPSPTCPPRQTQRPSTHSEFSAHFIPLQYPSAKI